MKLRDTKGDKIFNFICYFIVTVLTLSCLYPVYLVIINSFSDPEAVAVGKVTWIPVGFSLESMKMVFAEKQLMTGYWNSLIYLVVGTLYNLLLTIPAAYALSKKGLMGGSLVMKMIVFTMYFGGGLIPSYVTLRSYGLIDTRWVAILTGGVAATNLIIARTFFKSGVPNELEEAAEIDGCTPMQTFMRIVLPLSKAMLSVITLYYAVGRWNGYTTSLYFQPTTPEYHSLQMVLRKMLLLAKHVYDVDPEMAEYYAKIANQLKYAAIVIASVPLLVVYPFLQKYFEKGVMIGSVKG